MIHGIAGRGSGGEGWQSATKAAARRGGEADEAHPSLPCQGEGQTAKRSGWGL